MKVLTGGASASFVAPSLPRATPLPVNAVEVTHQYHDAAAVQGASYEAKLADGSKRSGATDVSGKLILTDLPAGTVQLRFAPDARAYAAKPSEASPEHRPSMTSADWDSLATKHGASA